MTKLTLSMVVKNEGQRYLERVLLAAKEYIDNAVIIDDGSTDNTIEVIEKTLQGIPYKLIRNEISKFSNEVQLRKQQWEETINTNPQWILFLDGDEILENRFKDEVKLMMEAENVYGYQFRLYDMWNEDHYRSDGLWYAHNTYRLFMIKYKSDFTYTFRETAQHCGRMPVNCTQLPLVNSHIKLKHYGWAKEEDRLRKYNRYMELDPNGVFGSMPQYQSILDPNPNLVKWDENS